MTPEEIPIYRNASSRVPPTGRLTPGDVSRTILHVTLTSHALSYAPGLINPRHVRHSFGFNERGEAE
jgi:hypothetical protein